MAVRLCLWQRPQIRRNHISMHNVTSLFPLCSLYGERVRLRGRDVHRRGIEVQREGELPFPVGRRRLQVQREFHLFHRVSVSMCIRGPTVHVIQLPDLRTISAVFYVPPSLALCPSHRRIFSPLGRPLSLSLSHLPINCGKLNRT